MNREEFLKATWKAYPAVSSSMGGFCGRVQTIKPSSLVLINQSGTCFVEASQTSGKEDKDLGLPIPFQLLKQGDVVFWSEGRGGVFLLSPNLQPEEGVGIKNNEQWNHFIRKAAHFFDRRGLQSIETPFLVSSPGVDHHIDFLEVQGARSGKKWFLPTSPEIHLKKALCQGWEQIYEIKSCFRDDLPGPQHDIEFKMIEWYRSYFNLDELALEVFEFMDHMVGEELPRNKLSVAEAFNKFLSVELKANTSRSELLEWVQKWDIHSSPDDDWNDLFFRIYMEKIEPHLGKDEVTLISQFPSSQASLAQINHEGWAERFEVYWQGVELGNAYKEVNDPEENRKRFASENNLRLSKGVPVSTMDEDFFQKLTLGMPPACGIAFGLSRFFNLLNGTKSPD